MLRCEEENIWLKVLWPKQSSVCLTTEGRKLTVVKLLEIYFRDNKAILELSS